MSKRHAQYDDFSTIDWLYDTAKERNRLYNLSRLTGIYGIYKNIEEHLISWGLIVLVGSGTGFLAGCIDIVEQWLTDLKSGYCSFEFYLTKEFCCETLSGTCNDWIRWDSSDIVGFFMYILFACLFAFCSTTLVLHYAPYSAGSGIPEVKTILGGFIIRKFLSLWTLLIKCLGLALAVASGLSLGKEGPLVHVACCVSYNLSRVFKRYRRNEAKVRAMLSAACSAGVSVAFGAPIGGVLFSLEEVSYYFPHSTMWKAFFMAMIGALTLQIMNPFRTGKLVLFQVLYKRDWYFFELPFFCLLGVLGGLYGAFFIRMNLKLAVFRRTSWLKTYPMQEVVFAALLTAIISYPFKFLRTNTAELVANLFRECSEMETDFHGLCLDTQAYSTVGSLLFSAAVKICFTIMTFGIKVPAGVFIPSMAIGACVGRAVGILVQGLHNHFSGSWIFSACQSNDCVTPGTYAMVGAAASLGGVTRMTISLTVIMFELTGALSYVLPIMLTVLVAKWVGDACGTHGIYDELIQLNGYPFLASERHDRFKLQANQVMTPVQDLDLVHIEGTTVQILQDLIQHTEVKGYPVVSGQTLTLVGYLSCSDLQYALDKFKDHPQFYPEAHVLLEQDAFLDASNTLDMSPFIEQTPITIPSGYPFEKILELFKKLGLRYVFVTKRGHLEGMITKKDLLRHLSNPTPFQNLRNSVWASLLRSTG
ncbi:chloride channel [Gorgonomyces haynaldii]|nr:chloride channel [Gorgonomyces haynaldii]